MERHLGVLDQVARELLLDEREAQQRRMQFVAHGVAFALRPPLQPLGEFGELLFAGDLVANDGDVARSFDAQPDFTATQSQDLQRDPQMREQYLLVFLARKDEHVRNLLSTCSAALVEWSSGPGWYTRHNDTRLKAGCWSRLAVNSLTAARWRAMSRVGRSIPQALLMIFIFEYDCSRQSQFLIKG